MVLEESRRCSRPRFNPSHDSAKTELDAAVAALPPPGAAPMAAPGAPGGFGGGAGMPGMGGMPGMEIGGGGMPGMGDMMQQMQQNPVSVWFSSRLSLVRWLIVSYTILRAHIHQAMRQQLLNHLRSTRPEMAAQAEALLSNPTMLQNAMQVCTMQRWRGNR